MSNWEFIDSPSKLLTFNQLQDGHWYVSNKDNQNRPWLMTRFLQGALIGLDGLCWDGKDNSHNQPEYTEVFPANVFQFKRTQ